MLSSTFDREPAFSEALTSVSVDVNAQAVVSDGYYLTNNDWLFGSAAQRAADAVILPADDTAVYMTVGNGGFESMSSLLPAEFAFLHVDKDPRVLLANQIARKAIIESGSREEFYEKINSHPNTVAGRAGDVAETWQEKYLYQRSRWSVTGRFAPWLSKHFLSTEASFKQARKSLASREVAYYEMDIFEEAQRRLLGEKLASAGARIAILNVTNVMDPYYNRDHITVPEIVNDLPTSDGLIIIQSTNKKRARASRLVEPYKRDGAKVVVNKQATL